MWFRFAGLIALSLPGVAQTPESQFTVIPDIQYCTSGGMPLLTVSSSLSGATRRLHWRRCGFMGRYAP
jgi:hypothetical protein